MGGWQHPEPYTGERVSRSRQEGLQHPTLLIIQICNFPAAHLHHPMMQPGPCLYTLAWKSKDKNTSIVLNPASSLRLICIFFFFLHLSNSSSTTVATYLFCCTCSTALLLIEQIGGNCDISHEINSHIFGPGSIYVKKHDSHRFDTFSHFRTAVSIAAAEEVSRNLRLIQCH